MGLSAAFFFLVFTLMLLRHDLFIAYNAQYIERELKSKIKDLPPNLLTWERYVCAKRGEYRKTHYALALSRIAPMVLPCLALLGIGAKTFWDICPNFVECFMRVGNGPWRIITGTLVAVNIIGLGLLVRSAYLVNREESEIARVAGDSLSNLEKRVAEMESKVANLEKRVVNLENKIKGNEG
jgi:hypothetical protein